MLIAQVTTDRYADRLAAVLSCFDRIIVTGSLAWRCVADGMTSLLNATASRPPAIQRQSRTGRCDASGNRGVRKAIGPDIALMIDANLG